MKLVLFFLLAATTALAQIRTFNTVPTASQRAVDSVQNAQLAAMSSMSKTLLASDSTKGVMLNKLSVDNFLTLPGNLTAVLGLALKQQVRNTTASNLHEIWAGTPEGNRLLTFRGGFYNAVLGGGTQIVAIPHGLGYLPLVYGAQIASPAGLANPSITATATYIILTFTSTPLTATNVVAGWHAR